MDLESFRTGVRFSRKLMFLNPDYISQCNGDGIVIMDGSGSPIKVFAGKGFMEKAIDWLCIRLDQMGIKAKLEQHKYKTANLLRSEQMLAWETERQRGKERSRECSDDY